VTFATDIANDLADIFTSDGEAESATFTSMRGDGADPVSCLAFVYTGQLLQPAGLEGQVWEQGVRIEALRSAVGIPHRGDEFEVDGTTYIVLGVSEFNDHTVICDVREEDD